MTSLAIIVLCSLISVCSSGAEAADPITYFEFEGHYYYLSEASYSIWTDAEAAANAASGHLVAINTPEEQAFIESQFLPDGLREVYWIGFTDEVQEGVYMWSTGEPMTYTNFAPGEPDNYGSGQDYSIINWQYIRGYGALGDWSDCYLDGAFGFGSIDPPYQAIIELDFGPVPLVTPSVGAVKSTYQRD